LFVVRKVRTVSASGTISWMSALIAFEWISELPGDGTKLPLLSRCPARNSETGPMPPVTGFW
jgi:hypothetical protein